ncbi:uncharacterized protein LOC107052934 isoform X4 [Gallus gallus]|uniref:uncharacterized protein LOC107052934 isoform X4 n=1 Tax=Gallus gallus TaxID=9031 RepID=UPI001F00CB93|nr:uncharacterized protein LOC107052934 isoform X4 [Gallus gallus]
MRALLDRNCWLSASDKPSDSLSSFLFLICRTHVRTTGGMTTMRDEKWVPLALHTPRATSIWKQQSFWNSALLLKYCCGLKELIHSSGVANKTVPKDMPAADYSTSPATGEAKASATGTSVLKVRCRNSSGRDTTQFRTSILGAQDATQYLMNSTTFVIAASALWPMWEYV